MGFRLIGNLFGSRADVGPFGARVSWVMQLSGLPPRATEVDSSGVIGFGSTRCESSAVSLLYDVLFPEP